jgi:hypothetical protein
MGVIVHTGQAVSVAANTASGNILSTSKMFVGKGTLDLYARTSAAGMNIKLAVNGYNIVDTTSSPWIGTTGAMTKKDHLICSVDINGGATELQFINTTGGALTYDDILEFTPKK